MTTAEKIQLYEELHPKGSKFPLFKKPDERPEDMKWLDDMIEKFQDLREKKNQTSPENTDEDTVTVVGTTDKVKVYTVNQIKCLPAEDFKKIEQQVADGKARVVN